jgi:hypothetical protein
MSPWQVGFDSNPHLAGPFNPNISKNQSGIYHCKDHHQRIQLRLND